MDNNSFRKWGHELVDWMADYFDQVENLPVKSPVKPGSIFKQIPDTPPKQSEDFENIIEDFKNIIIPGMTHWQSPGFMAYFTANNSYPSVLAEMLTATIGAQCMIWDTSPAATELEEMMMEWLKKIMHLPSEWHGVIQDTASTATLVAILSAREKYSDFNINNNGFKTYDNFRIYCSSETHSSIDKAVRISGVGSTNLVKIPTDAHLAILPDALEASILEDIQNNQKPICVIATIGTTGTTAMDPLEPIALLCKKYDIWLHVDGAYAGNVGILPECQDFFKGLHLADSYVFNPHKWLFVNFDCSAYFVKDKMHLIKTFNANPEYLKTNAENVHHYKDWGIQLGRRFRALKLWFVMRSFGVEKMQEKIREHIEWGKWLEIQITQNDQFELMAKRSINLVCFRYNPGKYSNLELNILNKKLMDTINASGQLYLSHTKIKEAFVIRMAPGQTYQEKHHIEAAWKLIIEISNTL